MQQIYQSPASRKFLFYTLLTAIIITGLWSCDIGQDTSMLEDPYPVEFKEGKLYPSDYGSYKSFGSHIDIWEDYAIIGCSKEGGAYIFQNLSNRWVEVQKLELRANYGIGAVCFRDGWIMVGTEYANGSGKVEVYRMTDDAIVHVQELHSNVQEDRFGSSIDMYGNYMIVGAKAPWNDCPGCGANRNPGKVYIFKLTGDQWVLDTSFDANPAREFDGYGREVAITEGFAFVKGGNVDTVYVYSNIDGNWAFQSYLRPEPVMVHEKEYDQLYGQTIAVNENTLLIGAPQYPVNGAEGRYGAVYVYDLTETNSWEFKEMLLNPSTVPVAEVNEFGSKLELNGDYAIVGGGTDYMGGGLVYRHTGSQWMNIHYVAPPEDLVSHGFGIAMDVSEQWMLVGHSGDMDTGREAGAVYVFENNY